MAKLGKWGLWGISWSELTEPRACISRQKELRHADWPQGLERASDPLQMTHDC